MKKQALPLLAAAFMLTCLNSCQDDAPKPTPSTTDQSSKEDLLTGKSWKVTDVKVDTLSVFNTIAVCDKDDLTKFNADKSVTFDEGILKCDPTSPQTSAGSWEFTANETKLKVTDSNGKVNEDIIAKLTTTTLIVIDPNGFLGSNRAAEITFTAQ